jgi:D-3-phosphoglycerate dehydrogenase / 2-oxoglutarate reductase
MKQTVLFIDTVHPVMQELLTGKGFECTDASAWSREEVYAGMQSACGLVIRSRFLLNKEFLDRKHTLRFIARAGSGMENIDVPFATSQGIACLSAPEANKDAVAEQALGMLIMLMNRLAIADREVRKGTWKRDENRGWEINGNTVAIIGFGNNGSAFADILSGFGVNIIAHDPFVKIDPLKYPHVKQVDMETVFETADIISYHIPLNPSTTYLINEHYLNSFQKPVWLVNTSRGKILNTAALVAALENGKVRGAALDVLEYESTSFENIDSENLPEPFRYLINSEKTVLSPHIAGWTHESHEKISRSLAHKIISQIANQKA